MTLRWEDEALEDLKQIFDYLKQKSRQAAYDLTLSLYNAAEPLKQFPEMGAIEPLLKDCMETYRYIVVNKNHKLIYTIIDNTVHIVLIWDCRQAPSRLQQFFK